MHMRFNALITTLSLTLLYITKYVVVMMAILLVGFGATGNLEAPLSFSLDDGYRVEAYQGTPSSLTAEYKGETYSNITITPKSFYLDLGEVPISDYLMLSIGLIVVGAVFIISDLLIKLLKSIENRDFFTFLNVKRIRWIGLIILVFSILKWVYFLLLDYVLFDVFKIKGLVDIDHSLFSLSFFNSSLFLGLMVLLVANAFEHGLKLKEEQDLTI